MSGERIESGRGEGSRPKLSCAEREALLNDLKELPALIQSACAMTRRLHDQGQRGLEMTFEVFSSEAERVAYLIRKSQRDLEEARSLESKSEVPA